MVVLLWAGPGQALADGQCWWCGVVTMSGRLVHRAGNFPSPSQPPLFPGLPYFHQSSQQDPGLLRGWSRVGCLSLSSWVCDHKVILPQEVIPIPKPFLAGTHPWFVPRSKAGSLFLGFFLVPLPGTEGEVPGGDISIYLLQDQSARGLSGSVCC